MTAYARFVSYNIYPHFSNHNDALVPTGRICQTVQHFNIVDWDWDWEYAAANNDLALSDSGYSSVRAEQDGGWRKGVTQSLHRDLSLRSL
ncbi:hypothetical protein RRG08_065244 [Elysia crispata]|uniref:Uncharacterized protein n=1 Tax=Elysia crispata TaxID=231223 RepID=A0AAE0YIK3_9GAST|nr:hypothetical protein RRG08_065244 [Elysia crispata]